MAIDLNRKLLEMELRRELERVQLPGEYGATEFLASYDIDRLLTRLLPFIERKIQESNK